MGEKEKGGQICACEMVLKKCIHPIRGRRKRSEVQGKIQPVCPLSVDLTSDLAEYGKEEGAESSPCVYVCVCVCFVAWMCPPFYVGGERR